MSYRAKLRLLKLYIGWWWHARQWTKKSRRVKQIMDNRDNRFAELKAEVERLKRYVGNNDLRSDYQSADHMRQTIEFLKTENDRIQSDQKALLDMLTDTYSRENPSEVTDLGVPDWITMAHAKADAQAGRVSSVDDVLKQLDGPTPNQADRPKEN